MTSYIYGNLLTNLFVNTSFSKIKTNIIEFFGFDKNYDKPVDMRTRNGGDVPNLNRYFTHKLWEWNNQEKEILDKFRDKYDIDNRIITYALKEPIYDELNTMMNENDYSKIDQKCKFKSKVLASIAIESNNKNQTIETCKAICDNSVFCKGFDYNISADNITTNNLNAPISKCTLFNIINIKDKNNKTTNKTDDYINKINNPSDLSESNMCYMKPSNYPLPKNILVDGMQIFDKYINYDGDCSFDPQFVPEIKDREIMKPSECSKICDMYLATSISNGGGGGKKKCVGFNSNINGKCTLFTADNNNNQKIVYNGKPPSNINLIQNKCYVKK